MSVNLAGIVKGSASVMAGITFELRPGDVNLTGYVDMRGHLDVLSLIALTMQVLVLMAYDPDTDKVEGRAKVSVSVKVLFFKKTVSFEVHHEFAGGSGDAARAALVPPLRCRTAPPGTPTGTPSPPPPERTPWTTRSS